jgi:hypothetical protein
VGLGRVAYRARQFFGALAARVSPEERAAAAGALTPSELRLFDSMTVRDQRHGLDVYGALRRQGQDDPFLLAAALLHDVGKGRLNVWHRACYVLLSAGAPRLLERLAGEEGAGWRQALWRCLRHPERGAALAAEAGSAPEVIRLIGLQGADVEGDQRLRLLRAADEAC